MNLSPLQEYNFRQWAANEGVAPTDDMRQAFLRRVMAPKAQSADYYDSGGPVGGGFSYPHPFDPSEIGSRGLSFVDKDKLVQNILAVYDATTGENAWAREAGATWYQAAREWVQKLLVASGSDMDLNRATSIVAQLSENKDWFTNMMRARNYFAGVMQHGPGTGDPYAVTKNLWKVLGNIETSEEPLTAGRGQKIFNFLLSILRGGDSNEPMIVAGQQVPDPVAVDRWIDRIAYGVSDRPDLATKFDALRTRMPYTSPLGTKWTKGFDIVADAVREAAEARGVPSEVMQAIIWVFKGPVKDDPTIARYRETGKWEFPVSDEEVAKLAYAEIRKSGGVTVDVTGHMPTEGFGYAPSKDTEFPISASELDESRIVEYIKDHPRIWLKGNHFGAWKADDGRIWLDVSRVGDASAKTIAAAQKAQQLAVWDYANKRELGVGKMVDGKYQKLGTPKALLKQYQEKLAAEKAAPVTPEAEKSAPVIDELKQPKIVAQEPKPLTGRLKVMAEKPLPEGVGSGPGAAKAPAPSEGMSTLGKVGRVAGPVLQVLGDAGTAYGLVGQAAQQGQEEELKKGHDIVQGPSVLGIPLGTAIPAPKSLVKSTPMTPGPQTRMPPPPPSPSPVPGTDVSKIPQSTVDLAAKSGHPIPGTTPSFGTQPPSGVSPSFSAAQPDSWWGEQLYEEAVVKHVSGPPTVVKLRRTGPNKYESVKSIPLRPGDQVFINGKQAG